jgi:nucleoside-diphosphate-sugar epimerase
LVAGTSLLAGRVTERLVTDAVGLRRIGAHDTSADRAAALEGVGTLVLLDVASGEDLDGTGGDAVDLAAVRELLAAAAQADVRARVVLSSAMVYGARPDNPVPLTEEAPVRPEVSVTYAVERAELERLANEYRASGDGRTVAVLRPAVILHAGASQWLRRSPWGRRGLPPDDIVAPRQFVHLDDVTAAVELACARQLDGTYNVAPDGWVAGETFAALVGGPLSRVPDRVRRVLWKLRRTIAGPMHPLGIEAYTQGAWVIASDRLRAEGWEPTHTAEETLVEADPARGWRALGPRARQELSLGAVGLLAVGAVAGVTVAVRRRRRARG